MNEYSISATKYQNKELALRRVPESQKVGAGDRSLSVADKIECEKQMLSGAGAGERKSGSSG
jgi:hypothetical protein